LTAGATVPGVDAALQLLGSATGTVTDVRTHAPLNGITVELFDASQHPVGAATTDAAGHYGSVA